MLTDAGKCLRRLAPQHARELPARGFDQQHCIFGRLLFVIQFAAETVFIPCQQHRVVHRDDPLDAIGKRKLGHRTDESPPDGSTICRGWEPRASAPAIARRCPGPASVLRSNILRAVASWMHRGCRGNNRLRSHVDQRHQGGHSADKSRVKTNNPAQANPHRRIDFALTVSPQVMPAVQNPLAR